VVQSLYTTEVKDTEKSKFWYNYTFSIRFSMITLKLHKRRRSKLYFSTELLSVGISNYMAYMAENMSSILKEE
jgi:hypothetical protein